MKVNSRVPKAAAKSSKPAKPKRLCGVHLSLTLLQDWIDSLQEKTGRSLEQWAALVSIDEIDGELVRWLKRADELDLGSSSSAEDPRAGAARR